MKFKKFTALLLCAALLAQPICATAHEQEESVPLEGATGSLMPCTRCKVPNSDGIYIVTDPNIDWLDAGNMHQGGKHLEDEAGNILTDDYVTLTTLSGSAGLYEFSIPAGHTDMWPGVLKLKDGQVEILVEPGLTTYRGVDAGEASFYFPVFTNGEYYDINGNPIEDLGQYLKPYGISLERDAWAETAITDGIDREYLPPELTYNYRSNITRKEYCHLAIAAYEYENSSYNGKAANFDYTSPFADTDDYYVCAAADLGIVSGIGDGIFEPDRAITRQEAAVLLCNLARLMGRDGQINEYQQKFADDNLIAPWAKDSVYRICSITSQNGEGIMVGTGNNKFSPAMNYTRQQAAVTIYRLLNNNDL